MMIAARSPGLKSASSSARHKRPRHFLEIGVSKPNLLAVAIGFNQAGFIGPAIESRAQGRAQAGILMEIKHSDRCLTTETRRHRENKEVYQNVIS